MRRASAVPHLTPVPAPRPQPPAGSLPQRLVELAVVLAAIGSGALALASNLFALLRG